MNKIEKLSFGVLYRKSNTFWNMDLLVNSLQKYSSSLNVNLIEATDLDVSTLDKNIESIILIPSEADVLQNILNVNKNIKWVHCMFAGVDRLLSIEQIFKSDEITLTNSRGAFADSLAEFGIFSFLYFYYNTPLYLQLFKEKKFMKPINTMLKGKTVTIVGYGANGAVLAKKAKLGFDMNVIAVKKNVYFCEGKEYVDEVFSIDRLNEVLPRTDFLVSYLPHTPETIYFFNYDIFSLLPGSSVFVNMGRGSSVIEEDLIKILKEKKILGASLDVTQLEPLPSDSPLFDLDNIYLSFHSADNTTDYFRQAVEVLEKNIDSYLSNGQQLTVVDKNKGY